MKYWKISKTEIGNGFSQRPKWFMNSMIELKTDLYEYKKFRERGRINQKIHGKIYYVVGVRR